jgi:hypothetical protein
MINLEVKTKLKQEEVIGRLKKFFGKDGLGLEIAEETPQCLTFEGAGGHVTATVCPEEGKTKISISGMGFSGEEVCIWSSMTDHI